MKTKTEKKIDKASEKRLSTHTVNVRALKANVCVCASERWNGITDGKMNNRIEKK